MAEGDVFISEADTASGLSDRIMRLLQHLLIDPESDDLLERMVIALCVGLEDAGGAAFADPDPWRSLIDPQHAALAQLPYASQVTGGIMPVRYPGELDAAYKARARLELSYPRGLRRDTLAAATIVAAPFLAGTQHFELTFDEDDPRIVYVDVLDTEVSDQHGLLAALNHPDVAAAGQRFEYTPTETTWNENIDPDRQWDNVDSAITWNTATTGV